MQPTPNSQLLTFTGTADRPLIPASACDRYIAWHISVAPASAQPSQSSRTPLCIALVIDRSGSMSGEPLQMALKAATRVVQQLSERDSFAIVIFDSQIDILQPVASASASTKERAIAELRKVVARDSTALHEGWLRGCGVLAPVVDAQPALLGRCFLLTDGQANVGIVDPEEIATQVSEIRRNARIGTSTFGFGPYYNEFLLGPMAAAGGGQFHHLNSADQIMTTFASELADLFTVAAQRVRLEYSAPAGVSLTPISAYTIHTGTETATIDIGDLLPDEQRDVVVKLTFDPDLRPIRTDIRARLCWQLEDQEYHSAWQTLTFTVAPDAEVDGQSIDPATGVIIGREIAEQTKREVIREANRGNIGAAHHLLRSSLGIVSRFSAQQSEELDQMTDSLQSFSDSRTSKEAYYRSQLRSRGQRDKRDPQGPDGQS